MDNHGDVESNDACGMETQEFNYDNCIIRDHENSNDSYDFHLESTSPLPPHLNLQEQDTVESEEKDEDIHSPPPHLNVQEENTAESEEKDEDVYLNFHINLQDAFVLVIGFLNKIEKYFTENLNKSTDEKILNKELSIIKKLLIHNSDCFGYKDENIVEDVDKNKEEIVPEKTRKELIHTPSELNEPQVPALQDKDNIQAINNVDVMKVKNGRKLPELKVKTKKNKEKIQKGNNHNIKVKEVKKLPTLKTKGASAKMKQKHNLNSDEVDRRITRSATMNSGGESKRGQKRKECSPEKDTSSNLKPNKLPKVDYAHYNDRIIKVAANVHCALTGEDFKTVENTFKEEAINEGLYGKKISTKNRKLSCTKAATSPGISKINEKRTTLNKDVTETATTDKNDLRRSCLMNISLKRKLYSPDNWIDKLPAVLD